MIHAESWCGYLCVPELINYFRSHQMEKYGKHNLCNWKRCRTTFSLYHIRTACHICECVKRPQKWGILYHRPSCYFKVNGAFRLTRSFCSPLIPHVLIIINGSHVNITSFTGLSLICWVISTTKLSLKGTAEQLIELLSKSQYGKVQSCSCNFLIK